jgi:hypothetical protein
VRGELLPVWPDTWRSIWLPLARHEGAPVDLFSELYRELTDAMLLPPTAEALADAIDDPARARSNFRRIKPTAIRSERAIVDFLERAHAVAMDLGGDPLANRYFLLCEGFLRRFHHGCGGAHPVKSRNAGA